MKLRRALAAAATTAVIAPIALLSAPAAFATDETTSTPTVSESTPAAEESTPAAEESTPAAEESTPAAEESTPAAEESTPAAEESTPAAEESTPAAEESTPAPEESTPSEGDGEWNPYEDCETFDLDDNLKAEISGLPSKIVAGSGWHNFEFVATNNSDKDLENVWIEAFTEYADENVDESLYLNMAEIQVKQDGKWTSSYQDSYKDEDGKVVFTGSFVASLDKLEANSTSSLDLRVRVKSSAPAGSSFALSQAIYAGEDAACYGNGEFYEFTVLAAGSTPGDVDPAEPNGEKPTGIDGKKPQGEVEEVTGNLAETGSSSNLPVIGTIGGIAIVAGAGVVFAMKRRKVGAEA
ncbi:LAETG motif-containing sortase-dependent surface protein [Streptomyces chartreusis]|uniref:LAETG motif-containing sortase-dependent surface protein n=1 Tax=Streptomyces TaxID=1883 RepID=UPI0036AA1E04|nr:LPXTG cell wall anchor domain-containing protein [Streptomyces chartreusis]